MTDRAFLFTWNPQKFQIEDWGGLDELVHALGGADTWRTGSTRHELGDWAFAIKLGREGKGFFARGRITGIKTPTGRSTGRVTILWQEFLDPRDPAHLLPLPTTRGRGKRQNWTPQANGTEVKHFSVAELHRLWEQHLEATGRLRHANRSDQYTFPLRPLLDVTFHIPRDLTLVEAQRLGDYLKTLVISDHPANAASGPASARAAGLGASTDPPAGRRLEFPPAARLLPGLKGGARRGRPIGSGAGYVDLSFRLRTTAPTTLVLPAGLTFVSAKSDVQNGILVQEVSLSLRGRSTDEWLLRLYCANQSRRPADASTEFTMGPIIEDSALRELFTMLRSRLIPEEQAKLVQDAVWEITDGEGLTDHTREALGGLPLVQRS